MGILTDIKVLEDGELTDAAKESFVDEVIAKAKNSPPKLTVGSADNPIINKRLVELVSDSENIEWLSESESFFPGEEQVGKLLSEFEVKGGDLDQHKEDFPQYHKVFIDGIYGNLAKMFDIEAIAVLQAIGLKDPTLPVLDIIETIKEFFAEMLQPILDLIGDISAFITEKINIVLGYAEDLKAFLEALFEPLFSNIDLETLKDTLLRLFDELFSDLGQPYLDFKSEFEPKVEETIEKVWEALALFDLDFGLPDPLLPDPLFSLDPPIPFSLDFLGFNWEGFDFGFPWFDWESFFFMDLPPGLLQILKKFLEGLVTAIIEAITDIGKSFHELIDAISEGIAGIIRFLVSKLIDPIVTAIRNAFPDMTKSIQHFATFLVIIDKILPMAIIATIGILIGSGLIAQAVAKIFGLI